MYRTLIFFIDIIFLDIDITVKQAIFFVIHKIYLNEDSVTTVASFWLLTVSYVV